MEKEKFFGETQPPASGDGALTVLFNKHPFLYFLFNKIRQAIPIPGLVVILLFGSYLNSYAGNGQSSRLMDWARSLDSLEEDKSALLRAYLRQEISTSENDSVIADANMALSRYYYFLRIPDSTVKFCGQAIPHYLAIGDSINASMTSKALANQMGVIGDDENGEFHCREALALCPVSLDSSLHIRILADLAAHLGRREVYDSAEYYLNKAIFLSKAGGYEILTARNLYKLGVHFSIQGKSETALNIFNQVLVHHFSQLNGTQKFNLHWNIAEISLNRKQTRKALQSAREAQQIQAGGVRLFSRDELDFMVFMSKIFESMGKPDSALKYMQRGNVLQDSIFSQEMRESTVEYETRFRTETTRRENEELKLEREIDKLEIKQQESALKIRNLILIFSLFALVLGGVILGLIWNNRVQHNQKKSTELENRLLRAQVNPHFFFNALTSIQNELARGNDRKKAILYLAKFSNLMRQTLESSFREFVPIQDEIQLMRVYLDLQGQRSPGKFEYDIQFEEDVNIAIPTLLIQPFIENSIEHGFRGLDRKGRLTINLSIEDEERLLIVVKDNGRGFSNNSKPGNRSSRGLDLIKDRLALYGKGKYLFSINSSSEGVSVEIISPYSLV